VIIARNDDYGRGLAELVKETFTKLGGKVEIILYDPNKPDLTAEVNRLAVLVQEMGADEKTAVLIIAFDTDGLQILEKASKIDVLGRVRWFGPDSMGRKTFVEREDIAAFLEKVNFLGTRPAIARNPVTEHFERAYKEKYGEDPTPYAYYAYDAAWLAMLSVLVAGKYDGEAIKRVLPIVAFHFIGATGHKILDENGDAALADYTLFTVVRTPEGYKFKDVGVWRSATEQVVWFE
jgi:branched-chain amino acid transport system substrate-binding protein